MSAILPALRSAIQPAIRSALASSGAAVWSPLTLFAALWYDPSDFSTMYQDSAGTTPVTAVGQPVGKILDKSGNGKHATQATDASRPLLQHDGTNYYLEFDGVDDSLATAAIDFTATDKLSLFAGVRKLNDTAAQVIIELSASMSANAGAFLLDVKNTATQLWASGCRGTTALASDQFGYSTRAAPDTAVITSLHDISGDLSTFRRNGVAATSGVYDKGTGNFGNYALYIGRRGGTTLPFNGRIYSLTILGRTATALEIAAAESYVAGKSGVTL